MDLYRVKLEGLSEPLEVTGNHPVYTEDQNDFVPARSLRPGSRLRTRDGVAVVESAEKVAGRHEVFNLEIDGAHRYYVTEKRILVHNTLWNEMVGDGAARAPLPSSELAAAERNLLRPPPGKAIAADAAGNRTLSGWKSVDGFIPADEQVAKVLEKANDIKAKGIDFEFKTHEYDGGVPGRFFASHAECQLSLLSDTFAVAKRTGMCESCLEFLSAQALADGRTFIIRDSKAIWVLSPTSSSWYLLP